MTETILIFALFIFSIILHECAHGFAAWKLGDNTAKNAGRISLNPLHHIDPFFTIILPIILLLYSGFVFGGPKPVPVDKRNFRRPDRDMALVAFIGPLTNFFLAIVFFVLLLPFYPTEPFHPSMTQGSLQQILSAVFYNLCFINILLGCFNLIPIPPLDGSRILLFLLPVSLKKSLIHLEKTGLFLLIILLIFIPLQDIIEPIRSIIDYFAHFFLH